MKKTKYLELYYQWMKNKRLPYGYGLCAEFGDDLFELMIPDHYERQVGNPMYWASGSKSQKLGIFTPLRQTIVLFMAAMNGEL